VIDMTKIPLDEPVLETIESVRSFEQVPFKEQFPYTNSYEIIMKSAELFGESTALEFLLQGTVDEQTQTTSFKELAHKVTQTANLLTNLGIGSENAVSIVLPILPQTHFAIWGAQAAGISNPINPLLEPEHMSEIISAAGSKVIICLAQSKHSDIWQKVLSASEEAGCVETILRVHVPGLCDPDTNPGNSSNMKVLDFNTSINSMHSEALDSARRIDSEQIAAYFHTGGTTGRPKLAQLTHGNMAFLAQLMQVYTAHMEKHTVLCGLPLFHIYGCIIQGVAAFAVGYRIVLMTPSGFRSPIAMSNFWKIIEKFQVKQVSAVPTVLTALADIPVGDSDISSLTNVNSGAAPLSHPFELSFEEQYEVEIGNGYGMTETTALISRAPIEQPPGSVGMRVPFSQIRIVHLEDDKVTKNCPIGESGVILVKGPQVFKGYKIEIDNTNAWIEDGWFNTGDLGYLDENDCLYLSGRAKDLIIRGGHNIDPELIEEPLLSHPEIASAIAIGLPDAYAGELPMAYAVRKPGANVSEAELIKYCEEKISERAAVPKRIDFIEEMPLTAVGKIFRPTLRQKIAEEVVEQALRNLNIDVSVTSDIEKKRGLIVNIAATDSADKPKIRDVLKPFTFSTNIS